MVTIPSILNEQNPNGDHSQIFTLFSRVGMMVKLTRSHLPQELDEDDKINNFLQKLIGRLIWLAGGGKHTLQL